MVQQDEQQKLVLVSGSGRSGTSSLAGTLKRLGLYVPQPEVQAGETNPRGFYEPAWVIDFHKTRLTQLAMHNVDSRPAVVESVRDLVREDDSAELLRTWLSEQMGEARANGARQLVVKDPHAFWFSELWDQACDEVALDLTWLTALRHPAEVVGSRDLAYLQAAADDLRLSKETSNIAGWVHAALLTERAGRGRRRAFVRYTDLLSDWRAALGPVTNQLQIEVNTDLSAREEHTVDDFIEPSMRKSQLSWDDIRVPAHLRDMAEEVWQLLGALVAEPKQPEAMARLDEIHEDYKRMYAEALALTFDSHKATRVLAARKARQAQKAKLQQLRRKVDQLEATAQPSPLARQGRAVARRVKRKLSRG